MTIFSGERKRGKVQLSVLLFCVFLVCSVAVFGQNLPSIVYDEEVQVGPGTTWQTASSQSPRWEIHIIRVDLSNRNVILRPDHREREQAFFRTSVLAREADAIAATNGSFFGLATDHTYFGQSTEYCRIDGKTKSPNRRNSSRPTFGITHDRQRYFSMVSPDQEFDNPDWNGVLHALAGGPQLVANGEAISGLDNETRHPRTILGWNDSDEVVTLVTIDGRQAGWSVGMSLYELAMLLLDLGCEHGINYDGGGSTTAWINGEVVNQGSDGHERGTVTALLVIPAYVIDHTDVECTVEGAWAISDEGGFYNANSLTADGGDDTMSVTWTPNLELDGRYKVYVWYTDGGDRTDNAVYNIQAYDGNHEVTVDQRSGGGDWVELGIFPFASGTEGYVQLTNTASSDGTISADAVKIVYLDEAIDEVVIDNEDSANVEIVGEWSTGSWHTPWGEYYHHTDCDSDGNKSFSWFTNDLVSGIYELQGYWVAGGNRNTNAQYIIHHAEGEDTVYMDQTQNNMQWASIGTYFFEEGQEARVTLTNLGSEVVVIADAVRFLLIEKDEDITSAQNWQLFQ